MFEHWAAGIDVPSLVSLPQRFEPSMINSRICSLRWSCLRLPYIPDKPLSRAGRVSFSCPRRLLATASAVSQAQKKEKVIVVSGPTGAGKSRLALELAKLLNGEIISADSVQVSSINKWIFFFFSWNFHFLAWSEGMEAKLEETQIQNVFSLHSFMGAVRNFVPV